MKNALIIFVRNPVLGKVKTRIAATAGEKEALRIYKALLLHTNTICAGVMADKFVFYSDHPELGDIWKDEVYDKFLQSGITLGEKMKNAFHQVFEKGYSGVLVIGSDCLELSSAMMEDAFTALNDHQAVIGPAKDGGYYLLGLTKMIPGVFENKNWSTATVCADTIADFEKAGLSYVCLPMLNDVDTVEDVPVALLNQQHISE